MYDVINVSITTGEVVSVDKDIKQDWKAKAVRDNATAQLRVEKDFFASLGKRIFGGKGE